MEKLQKLKNLKHPNLLGITTEHLAIRITLVHRKKILFGLKTKNKVLSYCSLVPNSYGEASEIYQRLVKLLHEGKGSIEV